MKYLILLIFCSTLYAADFYERNSDTGVMNHLYSINSDRNRYSLLAHVNGDLTKAMSLLNFELIYARKLDYCWLEFLVSKNSGKVDTFTSLGGDASASILSGGAGISYRSNYIGQIFSSSKVFGTASAFLVYHMFSEELDGNSYSGGGVKLDYGLHYRSSSKFHYGIRFSYNLGTIMREAVGTESNSARSLTLAWTSFALELGYYF